ncbi:MAG: ribosome small subunit-dependent GTPase A [Lachnospiraceae bacterium]|nr:ribosome small subunit-dependent GTPase A [Lachnospiraceae bacterium]
MQGKIIKGIAGFYYVHTGEHIYECKAKGSFRKDNVKPLVGDDCEIQIVDEEKKTGNIINLLERKNSIIRPNVANVDQALVIFASVKPEPNYNLLDRFLILMRQHDIDCIIAFNKTDLADEDRLEQIKTAYGDCEHKLVFTSAKKNMGIEELEKLLKGKTTTVAGPSGVGKSTIINLLQSEKVVETGEISLKIDRGKHTTRHSELIALGKDSYIVDTPGFSSLSLFDIEKEELKDYYPEFGKYENGCRFDNCIHRDEPVCGVKEAFKNGLISSIRYENYIQLLTECENTKKRY